MIVLISISWNDGAQVTGMILSIHIAEDDDGHTELITEYLQDAGIRDPIPRFRNGNDLTVF